MKIGIIDYIGIDYQQLILEQFIAAIESTNSVNKNIKTKYQIFRANTKGFVTSNIYSNDSIETVGQISRGLYEKYGINFIINNNSWYNDIISYTVNLLSSEENYNKTMLFIGYDINNKKQYYTEKNII